MKVHWITTLHVAYMNVQLLILVKHVESGCSLPMRPTLCVSGSELAEYFGIGHSLHHPTPGYKRKELVLAEFELKRATMFCQLALVQHSPPVEIWVRSDYTAK